MQRYLNELRGRIDLKEVASTHLENLKKAGQCITMLKHRYSFKGWNDETARAAYESIAPLAVGKADHGMSYEDRCL